MILEGGGLEGTRDPGGKRIERSLKSPEGGGLEGPYVTEGRRIGGSSRNRGEEEDWRDLMYSRWDRVKRMSSICLVSVLLLLSLPTLY